ncbi:MAG: nuclear transport factor 2 family protein [Acidimicrobiales bacterium]|nr:nuclear transport factor 2 family protein [Acidimicrobiales bacterium]
MTLGSRSASEVARHYVAAVNNADADTLMALFATDAVLVHPTGTYEGNERIRQFYEELVFAGCAELTVGRLLDGEGVAMLELMASSPLDGHRSIVSTVDVFDLDDDARIIRLAVYYL